MIEVEGTSETGSIQDALDSAIRNALQTLRTDAVTWELSSVRGFFGGFVWRRHVSVVIEAKAGLPEGEELER